MKEMYVVNSKKGDMNWMIIMLLIALVAMIVMIFIMNNVFDKYSDSTGKVTDKAGDELDKVTEELFGENILGEPLLVVREAFGFENPEEEE